MELKSVSGHFNCIFYFSYDIFYFFFNFSIKRLYNQYRGCIKKCAIAQFTAQLLYLSCDFFSFLIFLFILFIYSFLITDYHVPCRNHLRLLTLNSIPSNSLTYVLTILGTINLEFFKMSNIYSYIIHVLLVKFFCIHVHQKLSISVKRT